MTNLIYFRPEADNLTLVGNGNRESEVDPDTYNQRASTDFTMDIWERLSRRIPGIEEGQLAHGYAGLYTTTPDLHPVMDRVDGIERSVHLHGVQRAWIQAGAGGRACAWQS